MPQIKGRLQYRGYISPSPGKTLSEHEKTMLAHVYGACREKNPGEIQSRKAKCASIAWSVVKKHEMKK